MIDLNSLNERRAALASLESNTDYVIECISKRLAVHDGGCAPTFAAEFQVWFVDDSERRTGYIDSFFFAQAVKEHAEPILRRMLELKRQDLARIEEKALIEARDIIDVLGGKE